MLVVVLDFSKKHSTSIIVNTAKNNEYTNWLYFVEYLS